MNHRVHSQPATALATSSHAAGQVEQAERGAAQISRCAVGHHRGQQTLGQAHVQAHKPARGQRWPLLRLRQCQRGVGRHQHQQARGQQRAVRHA